MNLINRIAELEALLGLGGDDEDEVDD